PLRRRAREARLRRPAADAGRAALVRRRAVPGRGLRRPALPPLRRDARLPRRSLGRRQRPARLHLLRHRLLRRAPRRADGGRLSARPSTVSPSTPLLRVEGLTRLFGPGCPDCLASTGSDAATNRCRTCGTVVACADVSFELDEGEVLGIVGESGSGK